MASAAPTQRRDRLAIAGSIAVHLCVLALVATLPRPSFPVDDPDERTLLSSVIHIQHHRPAPLAVRRAVPKAAPVPHVAPVIHVAVTTAHASRPLIVAQERDAAAVAIPGAKRARIARVVPASADVAVSAPPKAALATEAATPAPVAPAATAAPAAAASHSDEGIGNFGESYPAAVDPSIRGTLLAGASGFLVRITVDENGRATAIEFIRSPQDAALREELRTRLLAARFIPAACNGLRCAGTLELRN